MFLIALFDGVMCQYIIDNYARVFNKKFHAEKYCNKLNKKFHFNEYSRFSYDIKEVCKGKE